MPSKRKTSKDTALNDTKQSLEEHSNQGESSPFNNELSAHHMLLIASFLNATNFISFVNERIGKKSHHIVDRGEALACITVLVYSGNYRSLNATDSEVIGSDISPLLKLKKSILPEHLNRDVYGDALEATYTYGTAKLYDEFIEYVLSLDLTKIDLSSAAHIDPSSKLKMGMAASTIETIEDDGIRPVDFKQALSEDHSIDKLQALTASSITTQSGLPLVFRLWDGKHKDKLNGEDVVSHVGDAVAAAFANIKTIVGDAVLCNPRTFDAASQRGLSILTRVPDDMSITKQALASEQPLEPICSQEEWKKKHGKKSAVPKARLIEGEELLGHKVVCCLIHDDNLRSAATKSVNAAAKKELQAARKLSKQVFKSMLDAEEAYQESSKKLMYCTYEEFQCETVMGYAAAGRPIQGAEMVVKGYRIVSAVNKDEQKVERAITHACMYLLATTDVDRTWTTLDFHLLYHDNTQVMDIWRDLKKKQLNISPFFLQKSERVEALLFVVFVALFAREFIKSAFATAIAEKKLALPEHILGFNSTTR